jgi:hypothetical protein
MDSFDGKGMLGTVSGEYWRRQYSGLKRRKDEIRRLYERLPEVDAETLETSVTDFFKDCFHVGDWLHVAGIESMSNPAKVYRYEHPALQIASAIANGAKHCRLDRGMLVIRSGRRKTVDWPSPHYGSVIVGTNTRKWSSTGGSDFPLPKCEDGKTPGYRVYSLDEGQEVRQDALELADQCVAAWDDYLRQNGVCP